MPPALAVAPPPVASRPPLVAVPPSGDLPPDDVALPPPFFGKATNGGAVDALPPVAEAVTPPLPVDQSSVIDPPEPAGPCRWDERPGAESPEEPQAIVMSASRTALARAERSPCAMHGGVVVITIIEWPLGRNSGGHAPLPFAERRAPRKLVGRSREPLAVGASLPSRPALSQRTRSSSALSCSASAEISTDSAPAP